MKFDTLLKLGTHAAKIVQHDAFQEMSKMVHKGVKRRMQSPEQQGQPHQSHWYTGHPLPPYRNRYGALPPYGNRQQPPVQSQANPGTQIKNLLTPDNLNVARQLLKAIASQGNNTKS
ncbi:MAG: hypothetical protein ACXVOI_08740 [Tumebacillaceae bacterium]